MSKLVGGITGGLVLGTTIGFFIARFSLEHSWSRPPIVLGASTPPKDSDPVPPPGTTVLRAMPIGRARVALKAMTEKDPVVATVVSEGQGDEGVELHVTIENHGHCKVTSVSGVAYGFDARGRAAAMNKGGEHYLAFSGDKLDLAPGAHAVVAMKLRYADESTLGLAHVDATTCSDGPAWKRP